MPDDIEAALGALAGLPLRRMERVGELLALHFGELHAVADPEGGTREVGALALHVSCSWRLVDEERILVGAGDLLTPSDPEAELESFDWNEPGASWLDVRLGELAGELAAGPPVVRGISVDPFSGFALTLDRGLRFEAFPDSTPTGHVSTEFWRLLRPGTDAPRLAVGTFGVETQPGER